MNDIGIRIREARIAKGWNRKELAKQANLSISSIQHIENNNRTPSIDSLYHIAKALDRPMDYFVRDSYIIEDDWLKSLRKNLTEEEKIQLVEIELQYCNHRSQQERLTAILNIFMSE